MFTTGLRSPAGSRVALLVAEMIGGVGLVNVVSWPGSWRATSHNSMIHHFTQPAPPWSWCTYPLGPWFHLELEGTQLQYALTMAVAVPHGTMTSWSTAQCCSRDSSGGPFCSIFTHHSNRLLASKPQYTIRFVVNNLQAPLVPFSSSNVADCQVITINCVEPPLATK